MVIVVLEFGIVVPNMPFNVAHYGARGRALGFLLAASFQMQFLHTPRGDGSRIGPGANQFC